jgi:TPR repeat protein
MATVTTDIPNTEQPSNAYSATVSALSDLNLNESNNVTPAPLNQETVPEKQDRNSLNSNTGSTTGIPAIKTDVSPSSHSSPVIMGPSGTSSDTTLNSPHATPPPMHSKSPQLAEAPVHAQQSPYMQNRPIYDNNNNGYPLQGNTTPIMRPSPPSHTYNSPPNMSPYYNERPSPPMQYRPQGPYRPQPPYRPQGVPVNNQGQPMYQYRPRPQTQPMNNGNIGANNTANGNVYYNSPSPQFYNQDPRGYQNSPVMNHMPPPGQMMPGPRPGFRPNFVPMNTPPMQHMQPNPPLDNNYLAESSVEMANAAGKTPKTSPFPPPTMENLAKYRDEANASNDPDQLLEYAKFLVEATLTGFSDDQDPKRVKKAKEAMQTEAQKIVKKLATHNVGKQGYPEAQFYLANCYGAGVMGLGKEPEKAFSLYVQGSKQSHPGCTYRAAVCYEMGAGTKRDKAHAITYYRKAANLGEPNAMYKLGVILLRGYLNQQKNPREGISWLKRASQQVDEDHPYALHELAMAYEKDDIPSVIPDLNYARELYTQAAQWGYAPSQFKLGLAYENGLLNCPVDPRRSIAWYSKAAEQGDLESEFALSGWYLTGAEGVLPQNDGEAYLWARKAADKGYAKAEYAVGYYTETGTGTRQNLEEAKRWYMRAAAQNYRRAMQRLTELKYGGVKPQQKRQHTRDNAKDGDCTIM